jgi:hypothetical protein
LDLSSKFLRERSVLLLEEQLEVLLIHWETHYELCKILLKALSCTLQCLQSILLTNGCPSALDAGHCSKIDSLNIVINELNPLSTIHVMTIYLLGLNLLEYLSSQVHDLFDEFLS